MGKYICRICGKEFDRVGNGVYCAGPHYRPCLVCGKPVAYHLPSEPVKCCSDECVNILSERSKQKHTRVCEECGKAFFPKQATQKYCSGPHVSTCVICGREFEYTCRPTEKPKTCSRICQEKLRSVTAQQRYGVDNVSQLSSVKQKISERNRSEDVVAKRVETNLKRWGVDNPAKNPEISKKLSEIMSSEDYLTRREQTCLEKYGYKSPMQSPEIKAKLNCTIQRRYGVNWATQSETFKAHKVQTNLERYGVPHYCMTEECRSKQGLAISATNKQIATKLEELGLSIEFEFNVANRSYDIHISDTNILIEIDPTYTHNLVGNHWGAGLYRNYHKEKSDLAAKYGYRCIHIFDWDDVNKLLMMFSPKIKIPARSCDIKAISVAEATTFLVQYHLQGKVSNQLACYGLYYNNKLIEVMTFGKPRYNTHYQWEILRLASVFDKRVVGGSSKLFMHFIRDHDPESIISYCDPAKFSGSVYSALNMKLDHVSYPSIHWSKGKDKVSDNLLRARGFDQLFGTNYGKGTSNEQLMLDHGWLPVPDCGQAVYTYVRNT